MGVVVPYASAISQGLRDVGRNEGIPAIRDPSARPSNVSNLVGHVSCQLDYIV